MIEMTANRCESRWGSVRCVRAAGHDGVHGTELDDLIRLDLSSYLGPRPPALYWTEDNAPAPDGYELTLDVCPDPTLHASGVYADIRAERARQDVQWGGQKQDDGNSPFDWRRYREKFEDRATNSAMILRGKYGDDLHEYHRKRQRDALVKLAALAIAQIESLDRITAAAAAPGAADANQVHGDITT